MRRQWLILAAIVALSAGVTAAAVRLGGAATPVDALHSAPRGVSLVAEFDLPVVRSASLTRAWLGPGADVGAAEVAQRCGFDPLAGVRRVVVFVAGGPDAALERVGFVARGDLPREPLISCIDQVLADEGRSLRRLELEGVPAVAGGRGPSRAAFLGRSVIGGDEPLVVSTLRVARGTEASAAEDASLARLWSRVRWRQDAIVAMRLPEGWRPGLAAMGADLDLGGIEALVAVAVGARVRSGLGLSVAAEWPSAAAADAFGTALRTRLAEVVQHPLARLSPWGSALAGLAVRVEGADVVVECSLEEAQVLPLGDLVRRWLRRAPDPARPSTGDDADRAPIEGETVHPGGSVHPDSTPPE